MPRRRHAHYRIASVSAVLIFGMTAAVVGAFNFHADTACLMAAAAICGLALWYAASLSDQRKIDRFIKDVMRAEAPASRDTAVGSVCYRRLHSFGNFENETIGTTVPVTFVYNDRDSIVEAMDTALAGAKEWVNEQIGKRSEVAAAGYELERLRQEQCQLEETKSFLVSEIDKAKSVAEKLGVKLPEDLLS